MMTQADLFKNYVEQNELYVIQDKDFIWFEAAGNKIGRLDIAPMQDGEDLKTWK